MMRLDKYLSNMGAGTRSEVKQLIGHGKVTVNGTVIKAINGKIDETADVITACGQAITFAKHVYIMLHKPAGVITATKDSQNQTVIDLIDHPRKKQVFPVGRLDKDTEGLLILTDDGPLTHRLLAPKNHIPKTYFAILDGLTTLDHGQQFQQGITLEDGYTTLPAELKIIAASKLSEIEITIVEGRYHQVKRMFAAVGLKVIYLKRIRMGKLELDETLPLGQYRELTQKELTMLRN